MTTARTAGSRPSAWLLFWWLLLAGLVVPFGGGTGNDVRTSTAATRSLAETERGAPVALRADALAQVAVASRKRSGDGRDRDAGKNDTVADDTASDNDAAGARWFAIAHQIQALTGGRHIRLHARGPPALRG